MVKPKGLKHAADGNLEKNRYYCLRGHKTQYNVNLNVQSTVPSILTF